MNTTRFSVAALAALLFACGGAQSGAPEMKPDPPDAPDPIAQTGPKGPPEEPVAVKPPDPPPEKPPAPTVSRRDDGKLLIEAAPAIPSALRSAMQPYLNVRSASFGDLSFDGKSMLITTRFGQTSQLHLVRRPNGVRTQITFRHEPVRSPRFVPRSKTAISYVADVGGNEKHQVYRLDLKTGVTTRLTDGKSRNENPVWTADGKKLAFSSNARNGRDFDVWVSDGKTAASAKRVLDVKGAYFPLGWSRDGKKLLVRQYISINVSRIHSIDVATGKAEAITPPGKVSYRSAVFNKTGKSVYITTDREGEFTELYELVLATKKWRPLTRNIPWNVDSMALSADGNRLAFVTNQGGVSKLHFLNTATRRHRLARAVPQGIVRGVRFAGKAPVLGFSLNASDAPGDAYTYNLFGRKPTRWTRSELGGLNAKSLVKPKLIKFKTFDGAQIPAFYYRPKGKGPFPVILNIHGGPESQARPYFSSFTQFMVGSRKTAVIYPNVRGSNGYGKSYLLLDNGFKREDSVKDIGALLDWVAKQPELDAKRVGVLGGSYGGYMVLASLVHFGDRIKAGVDVVGISSFVTFLENTSAYRRDLRRAEYGDERDPKMRAHLQKISPLNNVGKIKSALFVAQGANDPRVPASEAEQIVKAVRKAGHAVWYMLARDEGHGFRKRKNRDAFSLLTVMFFDKNLQ